MSMAATAGAPRNIARIATAALAFVALALLLDSPLWLVTGADPGRPVSGAGRSDRPLAGAARSRAGGLFHRGIRIEPNSAIYLLLAGLIRLTGDALLAHTLFLSLYGLFWIVAAYAVSAPRLNAAAADAVAAAARVRRLHPLPITSRSARRCFSCLPVSAQGSRARDALTFIATALLLAALSHPHHPVVAACLLAADGIARDRGLQRGGLRAAARRLTIDEPGQLRPRCRCCC
jgi:hypothetical protein